MAEKNSRGGQWKGDNGAAFTRKTQQVGKDKDYGPRDPGAHFLVSIAFLITRLIWHSV